MPFCLASAAAFGAMGIFGKLAYDEGATVGTLLATRFVLAAVLLWLLVGVRELRTISRRDAGLALLLGAVGYAAPAGGYFAALERLDASLLALLVYVFPVIVAVAAVALRRERASRRTAVALALSVGGLLLVLAGAAGGARSGRARCSGWRRPSSTARTCSAPRESPGGSRRSRSARWCAPARPRR